MKKLIISAALVAMTIGAQAQSLFNNPDNRSRFGVELGLDVQCPSAVKASIHDIDINYDMFNTACGFNVSAFYQIPLWMNLYAEPGLGIFYHTSKMNRDFLDNGYEDGEEFTSGSLREWGFNIPLVVGYHFDFTAVDLKVRVFTGPVFSLGFKGDFHYSTKVGGIKMSGSEGAYEDGSINRGNVAWRFGAGVDYKDRYRFSVYGDAGMTNALNNVSYDADGHLGKAKLYRNTVSFSLGYLF